MVNAQFNHRVSEVVVHLSSLVDGARVRLRVSMARASTH